MKIDFAGEKISDADKAYIEKTIAKTHEAEQIKQIKIHIKEYEKSGLRGKYDIHVEVMTAIGIFHSEGVSWLFRLAVKQAIGRIASQLRKKIRKEDKISLLKRLAKIKDIMPRLK